MLDSTTFFLNQINEYELLDHTEQIELLKKAQNGDEEAREKLIKHNLRITVKVAKKFSSRMEILDLIQAGTIGLNEAIDKFDLKKENRFITYAYFWVMQAINQEVANNSRTIRIPSYLSDRMPKVKRAIAKIEMEGRVPTSAEVAKMTEIRETKVKRIMEVNDSLFSLDYKNDEDDDFFGMLEQDIYEEPEEVTVNSDFELKRREAIDDALNTLSPVNKQILVLRYGLDGSPGRKLREVSEIVGLTKERVRQIEKSSLGVLRSATGRSERRKRIKQYI